MRLALSCASYVNDYFSRMNMEPHQCHHRYMVNMAVDKSIVSASQPKTRMRYDSFVQGGFYRRRRRLIFDTAKALLMVVDLYTMESEEAC